MSLRRSSRVSAALKAQAPIIAKTKVADDGGTKPNSKRPRDQTFKVPPVPSTPKRRRTKNQVDNHVPHTPTPSFVNVMSVNYSSGDIDDATPPPLDRPIEPNRAAATLVTPGGSHAVAYSQDESPSKTGLPRPTTTTGALLEKAYEHIVKADPRMKPLVEKHHCHVFSPEGLAEEIDAFRSLVSAVLAQQVSGAAAKAIKNKFVALFNKPEAAFPSPAEVAKTDISRLRTAGLSQRKAEYVLGLAEKFASGDLTTEMLLKASDDEVMEKLVAVRGLGQWSAEMFACFALKRPNILSTGDLGVQRGMAAFMGKDVAKLKAKGGGKWKYMSEADMLKHSEKFAPYRSIFMWYMWRVEDVDIDAVQNA
ncbi:MAG: hypothetical protein Q9227_006605 [Pyrenula ochraceoflavens]